MSKSEFAGASAWLLLFVIACLRFAWAVSPTFDEPGLIYAGYANLTAGATKSSTGNLVFAQNWSALPLLTTRPVIPSKSEVEAVEPLNREFGRIFLFHPANHWPEIVRPARVMAIILGVALGLVVFATSRRIFGAAAAQVSLGFYCLSPVVLANSSLATTDLATALWFTVAILGWWAVLHRVTLPNVLISGVATGLLLVTKFSSFAIAPMIVALVLVRIFLARPLVVSRPRGSSVEIHGQTQVTVVLLTGLVVSAVSAGTIWLSYLPQLTVFADPGATPVPWDLLPRQSMIEKAAVLLNRLQLLPEPYLADLWVFGNSSGGRRAFLWGEYSTSGWWYFFPVAWWFKTPIAFVVALLLAGVIIARRRLAWHPLVPLVVLVGGYVAVAMLAKVNIGIRHLLPVYPALFVIAGGALASPRLKRVGAGFAAVLLAWSAIELWPVRGEYLAYFNQFAGGSREGHRMLVDSSYEWGQDLPAVERWLSDRAQQPGEKPPVYFSYFGNADLSRFKIDAVLLPQFFELRPVRQYELTAGTYLISATMLRSVYGPLFGPWRASYERVYQALSQALQGGTAATLVTPEHLARLQLYDALRFGRLCAYLRRRAPDARVTHGIFVFELSDRELDAALRQPLPEGSLEYQVPGTEHLPQNSLEFLK